MLKLKLIIILLIVFIANDNCFSQIKSILSSKAPYHSIGFEVTAIANEKLMIYLIENDSTNIINLLDTTVTEPKTFVFIFESLINLERENYTDKIILPIKTDVSGLYRLRVCSEYKMFFIK